MAHHILPEVTECSQTIGWTVSSEAAARKAVPRGACAGTARASISRTFRETWRESRCREWKLKQEAFLERPEGKRVS